jgi:phytoene dehydrogenase-like protein
MSEVIVVGAGPAGLRTAALVADAGHAVTVLEATGRVGGRVGSRRAGAYQLDTGFQLVNPGYPALQDAVDIAALDLRPFPAGVFVRTSRGRRIVADPSREPQLAFRTLRSGLLSPREIPRLLALIGRVPSIDKPFGEWLDEHRITGPLRHAVIEPFAAGLVAQNAATASTQYLLWLFKLFVSATPSVPAGGMQSVAEALAASARDSGARIRLGAEVLGIERVGAGVRVRTGEETHEAAAVVMAGGLTTDLGLAVPPVRTLGVTTWWFAADVPPQRQGLLALDGRTPVRIVNTVAEVTAAAPEYAPAGRHLVAANTPIRRAEGGDSPQESEVRRAVADLYGVSTQRWELLAVDTWEHALPTSGVGVTDRREPVVDGPVFVAGDRYRTSSLNGALESGAAAARRVDYHLAAGRSATF